jgi:hypothetical protein
LSDARAQLLVPASSVKWVARDGVLPMMPSDRCATLVIIV